MKLIKAVSVAVGTGILAASAVAQAQAPSPYYFRVDTGYSWTTDSDLAGKAGSVGMPAVPMQEGGTAWIASIGAGYRFAKEFRGDVVGSYRGGYGWGETGANGNYYSGSYASWSLLANGYVDMPISNRVTGYLGAGAGMSYNQSDALVNVSTGTVFGGDNKYNFAWNAMVGISVPVTNSLTVDVGYRYIDLGFVETSGSNAKLRANELQFGLRF